MSSDRTDEDRVRELLADARHTEPVPDDVAARLDAALADLRDETPPVATPPSPVVADLAAARRRHNVRNLLVAAAAVVVVGVGISQLDLSATDDGGSDAGSSASDAGGGAAAEQSDGRVRRAAGPTIVLDSDSFARQVRRLTTATSAYSSADGIDGSLTAPSPMDLDRDQGKAAARASCDPAAWGPGRRVRARYDGKPGVLIYRPRQGDTQVVELYLCGHDDPTRSTTLARR